MFKKDLIEKCLALYRSLISLEEVMPIPVDNPKPPRIGDLRRIQLFPPVYVILAEEEDFYSEKLYKAIVFTEDLELGWLKETTPVLKLDSIKTILVGLPIQVWLEESFLHKFSLRLGTLHSEDWTKLIEYVEHTEIPQTLQGEYIRLVAERFKPYNVESLIKHLEKIKFYEVYAEAEILQLPSKVAESLKEYEFQKAASSKNVFKGKNFLAIVETHPDQAKLILYLPQEYIGKTISLWLKGQKVFEGELKKDKIVIEHLPKLVDYSFLEGEIDVQV